MGRKKKDVARDRQKQLARRKKLQNKRGAPREFISAQPTRKMLERLSDAYELIRCRRFSDAEEVLARLDQPKSSYADVAEAYVCLYQETNEHEKCCAVAEHWMRMRPRQPEAKMIFAQESLFCSRTAIALINYREFIERWPDHAFAENARAAIAVAATEVERRIESLGFPKECGTEWVALHEQSLGFLQQNDFLSCIAKCQELLQKVPSFASARNNLALAYFQVGRSDDAIATVEETLRLFPDNLFATASLAKLYFFTGRIVDANHLADQLVADSPTNQDALVCTFETLAYLGRDQDILTLSNKGVAQWLVDSDCQATHQHILAYAHCRLGDEQTARACWKKCLELMPQHSAAKNNVRDLDSREGHAPWIDSVAKWTSEEAMQRLIDLMDDDKPERFQQHRSLAVLVPALLDRGDPFGREIGLKLAMASKRPEMIYALKTFAFGSRGPDSMRTQALAFLKEQGVIDSGPHRMFSRGRWTDIQLISAEISSEAVVRGSSERVLKLIHDGIQFIESQDYALAEQAFLEAIREEPDNCCANFNLCVVWMERDGSEGQKKARVRIEQLHQDFPDYTFAIIALAQFATSDGKFQRARNLLMPLYKAEKLHTTEAIGLFSVQVQLALAEHKLDDAKNAFELLSNIAGNNHPTVLDLKSKIERASKGNRLDRFAPDLGRSIRSS
jgi:tetratricopeptide (TPR) repeat protein